MLRAGDLPDIVLQGPGTGADAFANKALLSANAHGESIRMGRHLAHRKYLAFRFHSSQKKKKHDTTHDRKLRTGVKGLKY